jgi:hypothetical protein
MLLPIHMSQVNLVITHKEIGIVSLPSFTVIQHSPLSGLAMCYAIDGKEFHLVTVNVNIGVAFVHVLISKDRKELEAVPGVASQMIASRQQQIQGSALRFVLVPLC